MRSVDLLESFPFVDEERLGVTGCSGGGTQSSYLGAADERIKAASMASEDTHMITGRRLRFSKRRHNLDLRCVLLVAR